MEQSHTERAATRPIVRKIRVPARVSQPSHDPRDGWFLLHPGLDMLSRAETLLELLNSETVVIPFVQQDGGEVLLLTRVNIDWVVVRADVDPALVYPPDHRVTSEQRVDLRLLDETHVHALVQWNSADGTIRLSDFLNRAEIFIPARTTFGTLLVNKTRVRETRLGESTERPAGPDRNGL